MHARERVQRKARVRLVAVREVALHRRERAGHARGACAAEVEQREVALGGVSGAARTICFSEYRVLCSRVRISASPTSTAKPWRYVKSTLATYFFRWYPSSLAPAPSLRRTCAISLCTRRSAASRVAHARSSLMYCVSPRICVACDMAPLPTVRPSARSHGRAREACGRHTSRAPRRGARGAGAVGQGGPQTRRRRRRGGAAARARRSRRAEQRGEAIAREPLCVLSGWEEKNRARPRLGSLLALGLGGRRSRRRALGRGGRGALGGLLGVLHVTRPEREVVTQELHDQR